MTLNPSAWQLLLSWNVTWPVATGTGLVAATYLTAFARHRRTPQGRQEWRAHHLLYFLGGLLLGFTALQSSLTSLTINSMALYILRLMVAAELVPPLLVSSLPRAVLARAPTEGFWGQVLGVLTDPFAVLVLWAAIIIFWNLPIGFNESLVSATTQGLLPLIYLIGGLLLWTQLLQIFRQFNHLNSWQRGRFGILSALPMIGVGVTWLVSVKLLYTPYLGVACLWNWSALQNQQYAGTVMLAAGLPTFLVSLYGLSKGLLEFMDHDIRDTEEEQGALPNES
jgi:putative membrane protein